MWLLFHKYHGNQSHWTEIILTHWFDQVYHMTLTYCGLVTSYDVIERGNIGSGNGLLPYDNLGCTLYEEHNDSPKLTWNCTKSWMGIEPLKEIYIYIYSRESVFVYRIGSWKVSTEHPHEIEIQSYV